MPAPPDTTPLPLPIFMLQSSAIPPPSPPRAPTTTSIPPVATPLPAGAKIVNQGQKPTGTHKGGKQDIVLPKLRLELRDLNHEASTTFLESCIASKALADAVHEVVKALYRNPTSHTKVPATRSVTLILRSIDGVAYTCGSDLDDDHKEIHLDLGYVAGISADRRTEELLGVLTHEMVHCYQYDGKGSCPSGLIEGIADWVRLKANLAPPHWKRQSDGEWNAGYDRTAYFLEYLEKRYGDGTISTLNEKLRTEKYETKRFWRELLGRPVEQLWRDYGKSLET